MRIIVRICNSAACTDTDLIYIEICDENDEERDETIEGVLENVLFFVLFFRVQNSI